MNASAGSQHNQLGPFLVAHLLGKVDAFLLDLLRSLSPEDWDKQTIAPKWKVKDVAAHLLDTQLRKLSLVRDGCSGEPVTIRSDADLVSFINRLNEEGVRVLRRLSPQVLISLLEISSRESATFHESLDPFAAATFAVSWAGDQTSPNWFDTARELTERWHHQQQIRFAVNKPGIMTRELYHPVLDCFLRGLPHAFRNIDATPGTLVKIEITGDCGGDWLLQRENVSWLLVDRAEATPAACVTIPQEIAWRIFTTGMDAEFALQTRIEGDQRLGQAVLRLKAVVG